MKQDEGDKMEPKKEITGKTPAKDNIT